jgi:hypothetical protein
MAILKSIKQKDKRYIFNAFDNKESDNPAVVIFNRFPFIDEVFPVANQKSILESSLVKNLDNTLKAKEQLVEYIINVMVNNITANRIDYNLFLKECVDHFENLIYDDKEINTLNDFKAIPQEAIQIIAQELYLYAKTEDKFTIEQKKI